MMAEKQSNLPKISIIMPVYNGAKYIEQAIGSILNQNYPNFELFIKDGGSSDETVKIIKELSKKHTQISWVSKKDEGQTDAINYGLQKITGEIITYLNADDLYKDGAFKAVAKFFRENPKKLWLIGRCDIIDSNNQEIRPLITTYKNFWLSNYSYSTLLILNYISQMAVFWSREAAEKVGSFDKKQFYVMDYDYWLRLGKLGAPGIINDYLSSFRIIDSSKSSTGFINQFKDELKVAKKYTNNKIILTLHSIHIEIVTFVYKMLR